MVVFLLEKGADMESENLKGLRPLHYAVKQGNLHIASMLLGNIQLHYKLTGVALSLMSRALRVADCPIDSVQVDF